MSKKHRGRFKGDPVTYQLPSCIDPLKSCTGVIVEGNDDEYPDGRRYQTLDGQA